MTLVEPTTLVEFLLARFEEDAKQADLDENIGHISGRGYAKALADLDAKRQIVDLFAPWANMGRFAVGNEVQALRLLAQPYADHPAWEEAWKP